MKEICANDILKEEEYREYVCIICGWKLMESNDEHWYQHLKNQHHIVETNDDYTEDEAECRFIHVFQRQRVLR